MSQKKNLQGASPRVLNFSFFLTENNFFEKIKKFELFQDLYEIFFLNFFGKNKKSELF